MNFQTVENAFIEELTKVGPRVAVWRLTGVLLEVTLHYGAEEKEKSDLVKRYGAHTAKKIKSDIDPNPDFKVLFDTNKAIRDLYDNFMKSQVGASNG